MKNWRSWFKSNLGLPRDPSEEPSQKQLRIVADHFRISEPDILKNDKATLYFSGHNAEVPDINYDIAFELETEELDILATFFAQCIWGDMKYVKYANVYNDLTLTHGSEKYQVKLEARSEDVKEPIDYILNIDVSSTTIHLTFSQAVTRFDLKALLKQLLPSGTFNVGYNVVSTVCLISAHADAKFPVETNESEE